MLAKLLHYQDRKRATTEPLNLSIVMKALEIHYRAAGHTVSGHANDATGTLGLFFDMFIDGAPMFVKTHIPTEWHRSNLRKEFLLMHSLYGSKLSIQWIDLRLGEQTQSVVVMKRLEPLRDNPSPTDIRKIIRTYQDVFSEMPAEAHANIRSHFADDYTQTQLSRLALRALHYLSSHNLISDATTQSCKEILGPSKDTQQTLFYISHGDLSNRNIMLLEGNPVVIDWEDALLADADYDYWYWLTFFDQRKYYHTSEFFAPGQDLRKGKHLMILIVVLKCYLAVINSSSKSHHVSAEDRIYAVLHLFDNQEGSTPT